MPLRSSEFLLSCVAFSGSAFGGDFERWRDRDGADSGMFGGVQFLRENFDGTGVRARYSTPGATSLPSLFGPFGER